MNVPVTITINGSGLVMATLTDHMLYCSRCRFKAEDTGDPLNLHSPGKRKLYTHWMVEHWDGALGGLGRIE